MIAPNPISFANGQTFSIVLKGLPSNQALQLKVDQLDQHSNETPELESRASESKPERPNQP
jgi:hypothetical protein